MIIYENRGYLTRNDKPNENWTNENVYVVEDGSDLANKIIKNYPYYEFVLENGVLVDITPTERPEPEPEPEEMSEIEVLSDYVTEVDFRVLMIEMGL